MTGPARHPRADHYGIAERGKIFALAGDHRRAMACYRIAIRLAAPDPGLALCARHYADCALESLDRSGALEEAVTWCRAALEHYAASPPTDPLGIDDRAALQTRLGCLLLRLGQSDAAARALQAADPAPPLARALLDHLNRGRHLTPAFVRAAQEAHGHFCVRPAAVDRARAPDLPDTLLFGPVGAPAGPARPRPDRGRSPHDL